MSTRLWMLVGVTAVITASVKAIGPIALGGRTLPDWFDRVVALLAPALLSALVVTQTFASGSHLTLGANVTGVAAAGVIFLRGGSVLVGVLIAVVITAGLRALS